MLLLLPLNPRGSNSKEWVSDGVHEEQTQGHIVADIIDSDHSHNSGNTVTPPNSSVSPEINPTTPSNIPLIPSVSPPQEDNKLGIIVFAVELFGALTNLAVSSGQKHNQVLIYVVVACSTLAFCISSTALVLDKQRPTIAKKMQKAAFLMGTFGFMGIMGMLLPSTLTWCFTVSAFLDCMLMFVVASLIK